MQGLSPQTTVVLAVLSYSLCSGSLVLVNKVILHHLPYPSLVITFQLWATLFFVHSALIGLSVLPDLTLRSFESGLILNLLQLLLPLQLRQALLFLSQLLG